MRTATAADADAIAALHADSWRRFYRGAYSDDFLDGDVIGDRLTVWRARLERALTPTETTVAEDETRLLGFGHIVFDDDPRWGALLDNLHVVHDAHRRGIGTRLLVHIARAVVERPGQTGLYLWVLEQNTSAQAFYRSHGAAFAERAPVSPPGGIPSRVNGTPVKSRYVWSAEALGALSRIVVDRSDS